MLEAEDVDPGAVRVVACVLVDDKLCLEVWRVAKTSDFRDVHDTIEEVAREFRVGDEDSNGYERNWAFEVMRVAADGGLSGQRVQLFPVERVLAVESAEEAIKDAREVVRVGRLIADKPEVMRVLDTSYANGLGVKTVGHSLREIVGSSLPVSPGLLTPGVLARGLKPVSTKPPRTPKLFANGQEYELMPPTEAVYSLRCALKDSMARLNRTKSYLAKVEEKLRKRKAQAAHDQAYITELKAEIEQLRAGSDA